MECLKGTLADRQPYRLTDRKTDRQTEWQTERQRDRQTDKDTDRERQTETEYLFYLEYLIFVTWYKVVNLP